MHLRICKSAVPFRRAELELELDFSSMQRFPSVYVIENENLSKGTVLESRKYKKNFSYPNSDPCSEDEKSEWLRSYPLRSFLFVFLANLEAAFFN